MATVWILVAVLMCITNCTSAMEDYDYEEPKSMDESIIDGGSNTKMFDLIQDDGSVITQLDMRYGMDEYISKMQEDGTGKKKRKAVPENRRWTNQRIPYEIDSTFSAAERGLIASAMNDYQKYTCLKFVPASKNDSRKVRIQEGTGCDSYVGMYHRGVIHLGGSNGGCRQKDVILHELGHTIGFYHEHNRPDRDEHVIVKFENIEPSSKQFYEKDRPEDALTYDVPYDYNSIMHYSDRGFAKSRAPTMIAKHLHHLKKFGRGKRLTFNDIHLANLMYNCAKVNNCPPRDCSEGFQGKDCKCWCKTANKNYPVKECKGVFTRPDDSASCYDRHRRCLFWVKKGFCNKGGVLERIIRQSRCPYSCGACRVDRSEDPVPQELGCHDQHHNCEEWAGAGECTRNPYFMSKTCQKSCNNCTDVQPECSDANPKCSTYEHLCNSPIFQSYLAANCRRTCGNCTAEVAQDELVTTTLLPVKSMGECIDRWTGNRCAEKKQQRACRWNAVVNYNCKKTCGMC